MMPSRGQRLDHRQPLAHADAGPDRPLQADACGSSGCARPNSRGQVGQPLVGGRVVRLAAQPGPADDAAERDQQPQPAGSTAASTARRPSIFGANGPPERGHVEAGQRGRLVAAGAVQHGGDRAELPASARRPPRRTCSGVGDVGPGVVRRSRRRRPSARRLAASSASSAGSERPSSASAAPVSAASASAHSAVMPLPPPVTSSTSPPLNGGSGAGRPAPASPAASAPAARRRRRSSTSREAGRSRRPRRRPQRRRRLGASGRHVHHRGPQLRRLQAQRLGQAGGAPAVLDEHEPVAAARRRQRRLGRRRSASSRLLLGAVRRQADQHARADAGRAPAPGAAARRAGARRSA